MSTSKLRAAMGGVVAEPGAQARGSGQRVRRSARDESVHHRGLLSWRRLDLPSHTLRAGFIVATLGGALGGALNIAGTGLLLAIWHDPDTLREWQMSGGIDEALIAVPLIMVAVGAVTGAARALTGKLLVWPLQRLGKKPYFFAK